MKIINFTEMTQEEKTEWVIKLLKKMTEKEKEDFLKGVAYASK